ncbi:hypothetical protein, partial [Burkholderia stabilis]
MANSKDPDGVLGMLERLTGRSPCPNSLRLTLIKYLREGELFEDGRNTEPKRLGKLERGKTDALVMNVLNLDEIFVGRTQTVRKIVLGEFSKTQLTSLLKKANENLLRRRDAYDYWVRRMDALTRLLVGEKPDLRNVRIDEALSLNSEPAEPRTSAPFALHAVQQLERSERRGRLGDFSAEELSAQADAYFALGDYATAVEKATQAVEADHQQSKAWFIRVMALLRQRNAALRLMQRHEINAVEIAEPMSGHEMMEREMADDAGSRASELHEELTAVVPHALLHWPRRDDGTLSYDREEQLSLIRDLFVDAVFEKVARRSGELLNFVPEGIRVNSAFRRPCDYWRLAQSEDSAEQVLTKPESEALTLLFDERATPWKEVYTSMDTAREFKLLHLSWALRLDGYRAQWEKLQSDISAWRSEDFGNRILSSDTLVRLWQFHATTLNGTRGTLSALDDWRKRTLEERKSHSHIRLLRTFAFLYHDHLVRGDLTQCADIARLAQALTRESTTLLDSPDDDSMGMPIDSGLYWKYLEALAVLLVPPAQGGEMVRSWLLSAEQWMTRFRDTRRCFWVCADEFEDVEDAPYNVDLRDPEPWMQAARAYVEAFPAGDSKAELGRVIARLERGCQNFRVQGGLSNYTEGR